MTQKALGVALGYPDNASTQAYVARWENGSRPIPRDKIKTLAALLNINPVDLL